MRISIVQAAKQGFKSRATLNRDVRQGKLPFTVERGVKMVDVADLVRLYGEPGAKPQIPVTAEEALADQAREKLAEENMRLQRELIDAKAKIEAMGQEAGKERDRLMSMVEQSNKMLADLRSDKEREQKIVEELTEALNRPLWKRIFGKK